MARKRTTRRRKKAAGTLKKKWDNLPGPAKVVVYAGTGAMLFFGGRWMYNQVKSGALKRDIRKRQGDQVAPGVNLSAIATNIHDAFYNNDWFGFSEDEGEAIKQIRRCPQEYIPQLAERYADLFNENMYNDFRRFLDTSDYRRVQSLLEGGMNDGIERFYLGQSVQGIDSGYTYNPVSLGGNIGLIASGAFLTVLGNQAKDNFILAGGLAAMAFGGFGIYQQHQKYKLKLQGGVVPPSPAPTSGVMPAPPPPQTDSQGNLPGTFDGYTSDGWPYKYVEEYDMWQVFTDEGITWRDPEQAMADMGQQSTFDKRTIGGLLAGYGILSGNVLPTAIGAFMFFKNEPQQQPGPPINVPQVPQPPIISLPTMNAGPVGPAYVDEWGNILMPGGHHD